MDDIADITNEPDNSLIISIAHYTSENYTKQIPVICG